MLIIDGSQGEGGGQIVRTALALSLATGTPFRLDKIRARRAKPGLLRQHLAGVRAAKAISSANVLGDNLGSTSLVFEPRAIKGGVFDLALDAAGSIALALQMLLPALLLAEAPTRLILAGATHVPDAPTMDYLTEVYVPLLARMGVEIELKPLRAGFQPAGGGKVTVRVTPAKTLKPLCLDERGEITVRRIRAIVANLPFEIAEREAALAARLMSWPTETAEARSLDADGPGNLIAITIGSAAVTETITAFGARSLSAEAMVERAVREARALLLAAVPVGPHLADQLLVPMALTGGGSFVTVEPTAHTRTAAALIEKFVPVEIAIEPVSDVAWRVAVTS